MGSIQDLHQDVPLAAVLRRILGAAVMNGICAWLEAHSRWSNLRELGQSNFVRSSVLMPVFGYLLIFNDQIHQYLKVRFDDVWPFSHVHSMWRIWMLYFGTIFLAAGSMLFAWRCPREIKQYPSSFTMVLTERDQLTADNPGRQRIASRLKKLYSAMSKWEKLIFDWPRLDPDHPNLGAGVVVQTGDQWGLGLTHIWMISDIKQPLVRVAVFLLFSSGIILLAIPAAATFAQVMFLVVKHLT
jgi:hypothetical protein